MKRVLVLFFCTMALVGFSQEKMLQHVVLFEFKAGVKS